ncbi:MAG: DUF362 domain-containing protein [Promethearchaeota archaeon]
MKSNIIYIEKIEKPEYPYEFPYNPSKKYPEYPFGDCLSKTSNHIYEGIRNIFKNLKLDIEKYNSNEWNPLRDFINPGDQILIKPNFVYDKGLVNLLCTHPSLIRCIIDYCIIALKGKGTIIIGDSPLQTCNFNEIIKSTQILDLIYFLNKQNKKFLRDIEIKLIDFRKEELRVKFGPFGVHLKRTKKKLMGDPEGYRIVNLKDLSLLHPIRDDYKKFRVTDYNPSLMIYSHNKKDHKYLIPNTLLTSNVVIEMPKIKTHVKAGITGCLKNNIGINGRKEFLPHYRKGSIYKGGDEYLYPNILKTLISIIENKTCVLHYKYHYLDNLYFFMSIFKGILLLIVKKFKKDPYRGGCWVGNDTLWRTIVDLNRILFYCNKDGILKRRKQRKILYLCDAIHAGEKNGPLKPSIKKAGLIIFGIDPVMIDLGISKIMGFNYKKIPSINNSLKLKKFLLSEFSPEDLIFFSNKSYWDKRKLTEINKNLNFLPPDGWKEIVG